MLKSPVLKNHHHYQDVTQYKLHNPFHITQETVSPRGTFEKGTLQPAKGYAQRRKLAGGGSGRGLVVACKLLILAVFAAGVPVHQAPCAGGPGCGIIPGRAPALHFPAVG